MKHTASVNRLTGANSSSILLPIHRCGRLGLCACCFNLLIISKEFHNVNSGLSVNAAFAEANEPGQLSFTVVPTNNEDFLTGLDN